MGRMLRGKLGAAFNGWRESQAELARQQGVLGKALARMKQGMMGRCWLTWKDAADEAKVFVCADARACVASARRLLRCAFVGSMATQYQCAMAV